jgi:hypothetical protein
MTTTLALLFTLPAFAGYGDVGEEGKPSWAERDVHMWTNAIRVDPEAFDEDYRAGGCSFEGFLGAEKVQLPPLGYDANLNDAARYHSTDMFENNHFDHASSDGTSFGDRISRFYDSGFAGENIAWGYANGYVAVTQGWMCSDGHRANIMLDGYTELGTGVVDAYYTQNFGGGNRDSDHPVGMGNHTPGDANHDASFMADWYDDEAPARFQVVVDGEPYELALEWGVDFRGVYLADVAPPAVDCHQYYFSWEDAEGTEAVFPEEGSYTYGEACDDVVGWVSGQISVDGDNGGNGGGNEGGGGMDGLDESGNPLTAGAPKLVGCSSSASASSLAALLLAGACLLPVAGRRRD